MNTETILYRNTHPSVGTLSIRPLDLPTDVPLVHDWVNREYARYWLMQDTTRKEVADFYREIRASEHAEAFMGLHDGEQAFLLETYDPAHEPVGQHYDVQPDDVGMHILVSPPDHPISGFTTQVFRTIMQFLFTRNGVTRVVVEPDVGNEKIHPLNRKVGFEYQKQIELRDKTAHLAFCTRNQFEQAMNQGKQT